MIARNSQIEAFKFCPRLANFTYDMGLRIKGDSVNPDLFFGKAIHKGTEFVHKHSLSDALDMLGTLSWPQHKTKTLGRARALIKLYAVDNPVQIIATERNFQFKIGSHIWKGRFDGVGDYQVERWVVENKTTVPYYLRLKPNDQLISYFIGGKVYYKKLKGVYINNFDVAKVTIHRIPLRVTKEEVDAWLSEIKLVLEHYSRCRTRGSFPAGPSCIMYNRECVFRKICTIEPSVQSTIIKKCFTVNQKQKDLDW